MERNEKKVEKVSRIGEFEVYGLKEKLRTLRASEWDSEEDFNVHYNKNKEGALNSTKHIVFRFANKKVEPYEYVNSSRWEEWKHLLLPLMLKITDHLDYKNRYFPKVMLANLPAKNFIRPHIDGAAAGHVPHKFHLPIDTNGQSFFYLEEEKFHFEEGVAYEVNNGKRHAVINNGESDRIHLIFECLNFDIQSKLVQDQIIKNDLDALGY